MIQANKLQTVRPPSLPSKVNMAIGGLAGVGKTHFLGTVGKGNKVLIIDTEGGSVTYSGSKFGEAKDATENDNIHIVSVGEEDRSDQLVDEVEKVFDYLIRSGNSDGYTLVALDSLTELQEKFLSLDTATDKRQSYGRLNDSVYRLINKAKQVPIHTVFTARLKAVHDEIANREIIRFAISPAVWASTSGLFGSVGMLAIKMQGVQNVRELTFEHSNRFQGKDRYGIPTLINPSFVEVLAHVRKEVDVKPPSKGIQRR